jgi:hypothetical protein
MKRLKCLVLAAVLILAAAFVPSFDSDAAVKGKWVKTTKGTRYKMSNGKYAKNQYINGRRLDAKGYWTYKAKYSWTKDSTGKSYKNTNKQYIKNRQAKIDGKWYVFDGLGYVRTKQFIKGYYYNTNGARTSTKGKWVTTKNGKRYQITAGKKTRYAKGGWYKIDNRDYYFTAGGYLVTWKVMVQGKQVFAFDSNGHQKKYTILTVSNKVVKGSITFTVTEKNKHQAAVDMNTFLGLVMANGTKKVMQLDGVSKTIENKNGTIYVDGKTLVKYVDGAKAGKVVVSATGKMSKFMDAFDAAKLGAENKTYAYTATIGSVKFTKFAMRADYMTFTADKTNYQGLYTGGQKLYVLGDVSKAGFVTELKKDGVIGSVKVTKNTTKK